MLASAGCRERRATICGGGSPWYGDGRGCTAVQNHSMGDGLPMGLRRPSTLVHITTTMLRFGVAPFAELRLEYDGTLYSDAKWQYQVEPLILGTKIRVFDGWKAVPKISFLANIAIPITKEAFQNSHVAPSLYLLFENDVTDWLNLCYNLGAEWNGVDATPSTFLALCLGFTINDQWGAFVESFNYFTRLSTHTEADWNLDAGFTYMPHHRVQLDVYASINCQDPAMYSNVGLGVAWLINP